MPAYSHRVMEMRSPNGAVFDHAQRALQATKATMYYAEPVFGEILAKKGGGLSLIGPAPHEILIVVEGDERDPDYTFVYAVAQFVRSKDWADPLGSLTRSLDHFQNEIKRSLERDFGKINLRSKRLPAESI